MMIFGNSAEKKNIVFNTELPFDSSSIVRDNSAVVNIDDSYLRENQISLDPLKFIEDKELAGSILAWIILKDMKINGHEISSEETPILVSEIIEQSKMEQNRNAVDVIFGNGEAPKPTPRIYSDEVVSWLRNRAKVSLFWSSIIAPHDHENNKGIVDDIYGDKDVLINMNDVTLVDGDEYNIFRGSKDNHLLLPLLLAFSLNRTSDHSGIVVIDNKFASIAEELKPISGKSKVNSISIIG